MRIRNATSNLLPEELYAICINKTYRANKSFYCWFVQIYTSFFNKINKKINKNSWSTHRRCSQNWASGISIWNWNFFPVKSQHSHDIKKKRRVGMLFGKNWRILLCCRSGGDGSAGGGCFEARISWHRSRRYFWRFNCFSRRVFSPFWGRNAPTNHT